MKINIKSKLIGIMFIIAVIAIGSIGLYSYITMNNYVMESAETELEKVTRLNQSRFSELFTTAEKDLNKITEDGMVTAMNSATLAQTRINYFLNSMPEFDYVILGQKDGKYFVSNYANDEQKEFDMSNTAYYKKIQSGEQYKGIGVSPIEGKKAYVIAKPLENGFIAGVIKIETLTTRLNNTKTTDQFNFTIVTDSGQVFYHTDQKQILTEGFYQGKKNVLKDIEFTEEDKIVDKRYITEDQENLATTAEIIQPGWKLIVSSPISHFKQPVTLLKNRLFIFGIIFVVLSIIVSYYFGNRIGSRIKRVSEKTHQVSQGDLTTHIEVNKDDELGNLATSVNKMVGDLRTVAVNIQDKADDVSFASENLSNNLNQANDSAEQVSKAIEQVAVGADEQAVNFDEIVDVMDKMVSGIDNMLENSQNTVENARQSIDSVEEGNEWMEELISQMNTIRNKVENMTDIMNKLDDTSQEIGEIVEIINNIAKQTNLLALNAAIEAARAGKGGQGFSVVADEIRELAEESMDSVDKISQLIKDTQSSTKAARDSMLESQEAVREGKRLVDKTGEVFNEIKEVIDSTHDNAQKADTISKELSEGAEEVSDKVQRTASIAQEISANSEEVTASAEEQSSLMNDMKEEASSLRSLSNDMQESVDKFKVSEDDEAKLKEVINNEGEEE